MKEGTGNDNVRGLVEEGLLEHHEFDESEDDEAEELKGGSRGSFRPTLWMVLSVAATLAGRRTLRSGFPYPFYFVFLIQLAAYLIVAMTVLLARLMEFKKTSGEPEEEYNLWEVFVIGCRTLAASIFAGAGMLSGAKALVLYSNLPVLAMLPILTYVCDSIFSRIFYALRLLPQDLNTSTWRIPKVLLIVVGVVLAVYEDYHLDIQALLFALAGFLLSSLSKLISKIGPKIDSKVNQTWESHLYDYLLAGIIPLVMTGYATSKLESMVVAGHIAQSWSVTYRFINLGPAVALLALFNSSLNSAFPFISEEHVGGALEEPSHIARDAAATTLQTGFWIFIVGVLGQEMNFIDWFQVIAFILIYILSVTPTQIGFYPPRLLNIVSRILRRKQLLIHSAPWQFPFFLWTTTIMFAFLVSTNVMYWVNTVAYQRNLKSWHGPKTVTLDTAYQPPQVRSFDIVIAHSAGDPLDSITSLISTIALNPQISNLQPRLTIYTKDPIFNTSSATSNFLTDLFTGTLTLQTLPNIGGPTATIVHHILYSWAILPVQTLFLSTNTNTPSTLPLHRDRLTSYFLPLAFPVPDGLPKTGFLNLGHQEVCSCTQCFDSLGWEDTFHLMPSMFGAAYPMAPECDLMLLTYGNNFVASAARIRGVRKDVWQLLYDALVNGDQGNSWAHDREKLPVRLQGEANVGRWGRGGVYEREDSLEWPYLGMTVERLWGVLLQCSEADIAWRCPSLWRGKGMGGREEDCGCIE